MSLAAWLVLNGCGSQHDASLYRPVSWAELAHFSYFPSVTPRMKGPGKPLVLPASIRALAGQRLRLSGYMMPVEVDGENVRTFILVRDQQLCCYGKMPAMNEWVFVRLQSGRTVDMDMDKPIVVDGSFEVGEEIQEGVVMSLYRMVADVVIKSGGKPKGWKAN